MKQKTFALDDKLAADFEQFCTERLLVEKHVVAASLLHFMTCDAAEREKLVLDYQKWVEQYAPPKGKKALRLAAKEAHKVRGKKAD